MQENPVPLSKEAQKALHEEEIKRRRLEVEILRASVEPVAAALRQVSDGKNTKMVVSEVMGLITLDGLPFLFSAVPALEHNTRVIPFLKDGDTSLEEESRTRSSAYVPSHPFADFRVSEMFTDVHYAYIINAFGEKVDGDPSRQAQELVASNQARYAQVEERYATDEYFRGLYAAAACKTSDAITQHFSHNALALGPISDLGIRAIL